ncbi:uncharacterized protein LOC111431392 [Cucurbita moschata]|uniref:Uncharacterized protein LOC111431392 n=1 Tax=Cucurbita moschata TaxID=3662 RepID=A0A6J1EAK4_CUCMO|nr:uncharacterized protein LOC111431392 [Cucurbita moschata]
METLTFQRRPSFSDSGRHNKDASIKPRDGIPQQKTRSSKEGTHKKESKKLRWYFANEMNEDYDSRDLEFATAAASAAFAIRSQEETDLQYQKNKSGSLETPLTKVKTRKDDITRRPSNKETTNPGQSSIKKPTGHEKDSMTGIPLSPPRRSLVETRADVWERHNMEKIRKRYEKIKLSIHAWENKKKMHAKLHKEKKMAELENKKALFLQNYQDNIVRIDQITEGARAQLEQKRIREEKKARETANRIRSTGRLPVTCFCIQYH